MVICVAVDCKSKLDKRGPKFLQISKGRKSETEMAHKAKPRNIQSIATTYQKVSCLLLLLKS